MSDVSSLPSLTDSGYPVSVRIWQRGTPLLDSHETYRGQVSDVAVNGYVVRILMKSNVS
jgi:prolyl oligopeptidase PreP (S9A serine peptidase family)